MMTNQGLNLLYDLKNQTLILDFFKIINEKIISVQIVKIIQPVTIFCRPNILILKFGQPNMKEVECTSSTLQVRCFHGR